MAFRLAAYSPSATVICISDDREPLPCVAASSWRVRSVRREKVWILATNALFLPPASASASCRSCWPLRPFIIATTPVVRSNRTRRPEACESSTLRSDTTRHVSIAFAPIVCSFSRENVPTSRDRFFLPDPADAGCRYFPPGASLRTAARSFRVVPRRADGKRRNIIRADLLFLSRAATM